MLRRLWPGGLYGCGPRPWRPSERSCTPLVASAWQEEGQREGRRGRQNVRMRQKGAEFEALGLLRTFVGGPAAAQWAVAGEAPASQLIDRSRPRPQRGNGPERMTPANGI